ncbi:Aste57867_19544 [Aphanomyces stellatus]|uniref:Aste57867_19544 protein n=1 Tax=Aphanomyces stellatus TaxID=120398 RepID=A0A485LD15_9STRA|nr:hypothetical protein As57867_019480 [Aphanomyces stellatus]VFT96251.1 Aste57867_19544 [Aphanomyces stellatus]
MQQVQLRYGYPQEEMDRIFNVSEPPPPSTSSSFHSSYVAESTRHRRASADIPMQPVVYKERGTVMGQRIDPNIPCWPGSGFVPLVLPIQQKIRSKRPVPERLSIPAPLLAKAPRPSAPRLFIKAKRVSRSAPHDESASLLPLRSTEGMAKNPTTPHLHTNRTPKSRQRDAATFHFQTTLQVRHEHPVLALDDADARQQEKRTEQKRWADAVQWLKQQREALHQDDKAHDEMEAKRQKLHEMDRLVRMQNHKRFVKPADAPPPTHRTRPPKADVMAFELPPRKPPVPRLSGPKKKKKMRRIEDDNQQPSKPDKALASRPPKRTKRMMPKAASPLPPAGVSQPEDDSDATRKRREAARVYMDEQKRKRQARARHQRLQNEEEIQARRAQLEKLDALRLERLRQSVALAKKSMRMEPGNQVADTSITELLLGFQQSPRRVMPRTIFGETVDEDEGDEDDELDAYGPTDSAPELLDEHDNDDDDDWTNGVRSGEESTDHMESDLEGGMQSTSLSLASSLVPQQGSKMLQKLQALKQLTDQLSTRVARLSNNARSGSTASDDGHNVGDDDDDGDDDDEDDEESRIEYGENVASEDDRSSNDLHMHASMAQRVDVLSDAAPDIHLEGPSMPSPSQQMGVHGDDVDAQWSEASSSPRHEDGVSGHPPPTTSNLAHEHADVAERALRYPTMTTAVEISAPKDDDGGGRQPTTTWDTQRRSDEAVALIRHHEQRLPSLTYTGGAFSDEEDRRPPSSPTRRTNIPPSHAVDNVAVGIGTHDEVDEDDVTRELRQWRRLREARGQQDDGSRWSDRRMDTAQASLSSARSLYGTRRPVQEIDEAADLELDRLIEATRDAFSVVDMAAQELFQAQQRRAAYQQHPQVSMVEHVETKLHEWEIERVLASRSAGTSSDEDEPRDEERRTEGKEAALEVDSDDAFDVSHRVGKRSIDELLEEANRVLRRDPDDDVSAYWDRAIRDEDTKDDDDDADMHRRPRRAFAPHIVIDDASDDANLRYSPRTLSRQLLAAVEFQESLHEAQLNLSALEYAHELERTQEETLAWGKTVQDEVESMAHAQSLLDQHMQMQEEFHQQELVLQAMGHAAEEREKLVEQGCQTDAVPRQHAGTMARWMVEAGTMAVEARDGFAQATMQHTVAVQSDDLDEWQARLAGKADSADDEYVDDDEALRFAETASIPIARESVEPPQPSARDQASDNSDNGFESPKKATMSAIESDVDATYSEAFESGKDDGSISNEIISDEAQDDESEVNDEVDFEEDVTTALESPQKPAPLEIIEDDSHAYSQGFESPPKPLELAVETDEYSQGFDSPTKEKASKEDVEDEIADAASDEVMSEEDIPSDDHAPANKSAESDVADDVYSEAGESHTKPTASDEIDDAYSEGFESPKSKGSLRKSKHDDDVADEFDDEKGEDEIIAPKTTPAVAAPTPESHLSHPMAGSAPAAAARVDAYLAQLRSRDPEKEEYIRSILVRKASEDRILNMRQRNLDKRTNISRMQFQAERMQLDSCRAANLARCYEDMMLFRENEPEDPEEINVLAIAFGHAVVVEATMPIQQVEASPQMQMQHPMTSEIDAYSVDEDEMSEKQLAVVSESPEVDDYSVDDFEEKIPEVDDADQVASLEEVKASGNIEEDDDDDVPDDEVVDDNDYSMDDFAAKEDSIEEGVQAKDEEPAVDIEPSIDEESAKPSASTNVEENHDIAEDNAPEDLPEDKVAETAVADDVVDDDVFEEFAEEEDAIADKNAADVVEDKLTHVDTIKGDDVVYDYSMDEFASGSAAAAAPVEEVDEPEENAVEEVPTTAASVGSDNYSDEFASNGDDGSVKDSIEIEEDAMEKDDHARYEIASTSADPLPSVVDEPMKDRSGEYSMDEFASGGEILPSKDDEYSDDEDQRSMLEGDVDVAEKASNTSQELQMALEKIEKEYPREVVRDEAKWQRRKEKALALVEAKERAIDRRKKEMEIEDINALVHYSLSLNVDDEVRRAVPMMGSLLPTMVVHQEGSNPAVVVSSPQVMASPVAVDGGSSAGEYSNSFEETKSEAAYTDDAFEDEVRENVADDPPLPLVEATDQVISAPQPPKQVEAFDKTDGLESSLSKSIDEHEARLMGLKETLMVKQEEALKVKEEVAKEERRVQLVEQERDLAMQIEQTNCVVATEQARLSVLQHQRKEWGDTEREFPTADVALGLADDMSFEDDDGSTQHGLDEAQDEQSEMFDPSEIPEPTTIVTSTTKGDLLEGVARPFDLSCDGESGGVDRSMELSIVDGDSISGDDDADQSFASDEPSSLPHEVAPIDALPENVQPQPIPSMPTPPRVLPEVLDDSFTSVGGGEDESSEQVDLLAGFDHVEAAMASNWTHEIAIQTHDMIVNPLDTYDYVEVAERPVPGFKEAPPDNLLAGYDYVVQANPPQDIDTSEDDVVRPEENVALDDEDKESPLRSNDLLDGYEYVEEAMHPTLGQGTREKVEIDASEEVATEADDITTLHGDSAQDDCLDQAKIEDEREDDTVAELAAPGLLPEAPSGHFIAYDHVEAAIAPSLPLERAMLPMEYPFISLDEFDYIEEAEKVQRQRQIEFDEMYADNDEPLDLLGAYDYVEDVWPVTPSQSHPRVDDDDVILPSGHDNDVVESKFVDETVETLPEDDATPHATRHMRRDNELATRVDMITDLVWKELLHEVLTEPAIATSTKSGPHGEPTTREATPTTHDDDADAATSSLDRVTDLLLDEVVKDTFYAVLQARREMSTRSVAHSSSSASPANNNRPQATAPPGSAMRNVTEFPDQYTAVMEARQAHDWTAWDDEWSDQSPPSTPSASLSASAANARRRLLRERSSNGHNVAQSSLSPLGATSVKEYLREMHALSKHTVAAAASRFVKHVVETDQSLIDDLFEDLLQDTATAVITHL